MVPGGGGGERLALCSGSWGGGGERLALCGGSWGGG